jgi:hypothetical protein
MVCVVSLDAFTHLDVALIGLGIDERLGTISALEATLENNNLPVLVHALVLDTGTGIRTQKYRYLV